MNRNKSLGLTKNRSTREPQRRNDNDRGLMRMSEFSDFDRMFEGFGNIDRFFGDFRSRFDDFEDHFMSLGSNQGQGTVITKSYVSKVKYDQNGQPHKETYQTQSIKQTDRDGRSIQEKQQAYQNTKSGLQKAAHERLLDEKGLKVVKARNMRTGEEYEHNLYKGMNENDLDNFNMNYNDYRNKVKFQDNYKYLSDPRRGLPQNPQIQQNAQNSSSLNYNRQGQPRALPENNKLRR